MLSRFVVNDKKYRSLALKICGCPIQKDDLVNDMYLALHDILKKEPEKKITDSYIYLIMRSLFLNGVKRAKPETIPMEGLEISEEANSRLHTRQQVDNVLSKLSFYDKEILMKTQEESLRSLAEKVGCHYVTIHNRKKEAIIEFTKLWIAS